MEDLNLSKTESGKEAPGNNAPSEKKTYSAPNLISYGHLAALVKNFPSVANDAGVADCNHC